MRLSNINIQFMYGSHEPIIKFEVLPTRIDETGQFTINQTLIDNLKQAAINLSNAVANG